MKALYDAFAGVTPIASIPNAREYHAEMRRMRESLEESVAGLTAGYPRLYGYGRKPKGRSRDV